MTDIEPTQYPPILKVDLSKLETTSISVHLPLAVVSVLNELATRLGVAQTVLTRAGTLILLQSITIDLSENSCYAPSDVIEAIVQAAGANTTFPTNFEELVNSLFPTINPSKEDINHEHNKPE